MKIYKKQYTIRIDILLLCSVGNPLNLLKIINRPRIKIR